VLGKIGVGVVIGAWLKAGFRASILQNFRQELFGGFVAGSFEDLHDGAEFYEATFGKETDLVADLAGEAHLVGDEDEVASFFTELFNHVQDFRGHFGVKGGGGFVEEKQARFDGDGPGDGDALSLAAGKFGGLFVAVVGELEAFEKFQGLGFCVSQSVAVHLFEGQSDILKRGKMGEEVKGLKDGSDGSPMADQAGFVIDDRRTVDGYDAVVRIFKAGNDAEQGGFASAGGTDQDQGVHFLQMQGNVLEHWMSIEALA
jgi:hypothetical protein